LENVGDGVIDPCDEELGMKTNIYLCDEKDCGQQAVVVLPDYSKCDDHDKDQKITELLQAYEKRKKKSLTAPKNRVIL
jgi:hypothetical protein